MFAILGVPFYIYIYIYIYMCTLWELWAWLPPIGSGFEVLKHWGAWRSFPEPRGGVFFLGASWPKKKRQRQQPKASQPDVLGGAVYKRERKKKTNRSRTGPVSRGWSLLKQEEVHVSVVLEVSYIMRVDPLCFISKRQPELAIPL